MESPSESLLKSPPGPPTEQPLPPASRRAAANFIARGSAVPAWVGLLRLVEDFVATWDDPRAVPKRARDNVYRRDGWRCMAPGCTSRAQLEDHHIEFRSQGGSDAEWNRLLVCATHHRMGVHGGLAHCSGRAPFDVVWRLGRPDLATWYRNERRIPPPEGGVEGGVEGSPDPAD